MPGVAQGSDLAALLFRDVAHLLASAALLLSFLLLRAARIRSLIRLYALQAAVIAAAAAWQGLVQDAPGLYTAAALTLGVKMAAIPVMLNRIAAHAPNPSERRRMALGPVAAWLAGIGCVVLGVLVASSATIAAPLTEDDLGLALAIILLGLVMMVASPGGLAETVGFLSLENGLVLAAFGVPGLPPLVAIASMLLPAARVSFLFVLRAPERLEAADLAHLGLPPGAAR